MKITTRVQGLDDLRLRVVRLVDDMQAKVYQGALEKGAAIVVERAKSIAAGYSATKTRAQAVEYQHVKRPIKGDFWLVDVGLRSGVFLTKRRARRLGGFHATRTIKTRSDSKRGSKNVRRNVGGKYYYPDEAARYGAILERGTKYTAAQPILLPALTATHAESVEAMAREIGRALDEHSRAGTLRNRPGTE
jgi:HK97 gp10 family phage protein